MEPRQRVNSEKIIVQQDEDSSTSSPVRIRSRAATRRDSIRSELKLQMRQSVFSPKKGIQKNEIFNKKYVAMCKIGEGGNAVVRRCKKLGDKTINYVVKIMKFNDTEEVLRQQEEYYIGSNLNHQNIVRCYDFIIEKSNKKGYLVQEYVRGDSLTKFMLRNKKINSNKIRNIMYQTCQGVQYLHKHDICHRDLHCGNIIYNDQTKKVKIIDFSISKKLKKEIIKMMTQSGILYFMAPEQLDGGYYGKEVDIWALGIVFYTLIYGQYPFKTEDDYKESVTNSILSQELVFPEEKQEEFQQVNDLLKQMLNRDISQRYNIKQCLQHPWFSNNKGKILKEQMEYKQDDLVVKSSVSCGSENTMPMISISGLQIKSQQNNISSKQNLIQLKKYNNTVNEQTDSIESNKSTHPSIQCIDLTQKGIKDDILQNNINYYNKESSLNKIIIEEEQNSNKKTQTQNTSYQNSSNNSNFNSNNKPEKRMKFNHYMRVGSIQLSQSNLQDEEESILINKNIGYHSFCSLQELATTNL